MKKIKVFTYIDRFTGPFLDVWVNYYSKIKNSSLSVLCRNEVDPVYVNKYENVEFIYVGGYFTNHSRNEYTAPLNLFIDYQNTFLSKSDVVIYSDLDEIIIHPNIDDVVQSNFDGCLVTTGVEIVHHVSVESRLNFNEPINRQRSNIIYTEWYDKPLIVNRPIGWGCPGKHNYEVHPKTIDELYLVHLGKICFDHIKDFTNENIDMYGQRRWYGFPIPLREDSYVNTFNDPHSQKYPMVKIPDNLKLLIDKII
tara:strand:+ start:4340 stop:5098 length:759 start_codon:yes stop_codon:yes gene_type:complete